MKLYSGKDLEYITEQPFPKLCRYDEVKELLEGILSCIENPKTKYPEVLEYTYNSIKDLLNDN